MRVLDCAQRLTIERLMSMFELMPDGVLKWIDPPKPHPDLYGQIAGSPIPSQSGKWYWNIQIDGRKYKRSRIVFCLTRGHWPQHQIDHINGQSLDDRPSNLREATQMQNAWNHHRRAKRSATPMGVRQIPSGRFIARISVNKQHIHLGVFSTPEDAAAAYQAARQQYFGEFA